MRHLRRTLQEALTIWVTLIGGTIVAAFLYAVLSVAGVPENTSLILALATLLALILLVELIKPKAFWLIHTEHLRMRFLLFFLRIRTPNRVYRMDSTSRVIVAIAIITTTMGVSVYLLWLVGVSIIILISGAATTLAIGVLILPLLFNIQEFLRELHQYGESDQYYKRRPRPPDL